MTPQKLLRDLVTAVLAWEEADALRAKIADSKKASDTDLTAANKKLVSTIKNLRVIARILRTMMDSNPKKKKKFQIDWLKALDITTQALNTVKEVTDKTRPRPLSARVIDVDAEVVR